MQTKVENYYALLLTSLVYQEEGDFDREDEILSKLDGIWLSMNFSERTQAEGLTYIISQKDESTSPIRSIDMELVYADKVQAWDFKMPTVQKKTEFTALFSATVGSEKYLNPLPKNYRAVNSVQPFSSYSMAA